MKDEPLPSLNYNLFAYCLQMKNKNRGYCDLCGTYFRGLHPTSSKIFSKKQVRELRRMNLCAKCYLRVYKMSTAHTKITLDERIEVMKGLKIELLEEKERRLRASKKGVNTP